LHFPPEEKKKDAENALINAETPRSTLTEVETPIVSSTASKPKSCSRKKKTFGHDFFQDENQGQQQGKLSLTVSVSFRASKLAVLAVSNSETDMHFAITLFKKQNYQVVLLLLLLEIKKCHSQGKKAPLMLQ